MAEVKIKVSTHDNDTTNIDMNLTGSTLEVTLGDKKASADLSGLVPATLADRFINGGRFDKETQSLILVTSKEGEEDQEVTIPLSALFGSALEIEEVLSKEEQGLSGQSFEVNQYGYSGTIPVVGLGRIKGTDFYVVKLDPAVVDSHKTAIEQEGQKRAFVAADLTPLNENIIAVFKQDGANKVTANVRNFAINDYLNIRNNTKPQRLELVVNGTKIFEAYATTEADGSVSGYSNNYANTVEVTDSINVVVKDPSTNTSLYGFTTTVDQANAVFSEEAKRNFRNYEEYLTLSKADFSVTGSMNDNTLTFLKDAFTLRDIDKIKQGSLPDTIYLKVYEAYASDPLLTVAYTAYKEEGKIIDYRATEKPSVHLTYFPRILTYFEKDGGTLDKSVMKLKCG